MSDPQKTLEEALKRLGETATRIAGDDAPRIVSLLADQTVFAGLEMMVRTHHVLPEAAATQSAQPAAVVAGSATFKEASSVMSDGQSLFGPSRVVDRISVIFPADWEAPPIPWTKGYLTDAKGIVLICLLPKPHKLGILSFRFTDPKKVKWQDRSVATVPEEEIGSGWLLMNRVPHPDLDKLSLEDQQKKAAELGGRLPTLAELAYAYQIGALIMDAGARVRTSSLAKGDKTFIATCVEGGIIQIGIGKATAKDAGSFIVRVPPT